VKGFLKEGAADRADAFAAEADGLEALRRHIRVPRVLERGVKDGKAFILLEQLDLRRAGDWSAMGRMLAALHRQTGPRFGWHRDNYIGLSPQINGWRESWAEFFRECRIRPQLELARSNGFSWISTSSSITSRSPRCCTAICGAATRASPRKGRWSTTRRCTTAIARQTSR
jgi:fructosamine-3-kinase